MFDFDYLNDTDPQIEWDDVKIGDEALNTSEDVSMIDTVDSFVDNTMLAQEHWTENINNGSCQISFGNHIDDLYDPSINSAQDNYINHIEEATNARTTDELKYHLDKAEDAQNSEKFWKEAKHDAEIEATKHDIFIDGINKQWEIMDKYQKEIEDIYKK